MNQIGLNLSNQFYGKGKPMDPKDLLVSDSQMYTIFFYGMNCFDLWTKVKILSKVNFFKLSLKSLEPRIHFVSDESKLKGSILFLFGSMLLEQTSFLVQVFNVCENSMIETFASTHPDLDDTEGFFRRQANPHNIIGDLFFLC